MPTHNRLEIQNNAASRIRSAFDALGVDFSSPDRLIATLPFSRDDVTAGSESELQAAVLGRAEDVDLAVSLRKSSFYSSSLKRVRAGEIPPKTLSDIETFVDLNREGVWENSWVRFPFYRLSSGTQKMFEEDLRADKSKSDSILREDADQFLLQQEGEPWVRIPISYVLKLALGEFLYQVPSLPNGVRQTGQRLLDHFLNDNTSPETHSFYITALNSASGMGKALAAETCQRYLLTQCLVLYANQKFSLGEHGQEAVVFYSPHPPSRQKRLNELIPDSFYRELFMSPCLSGWDEGARKHEYMSLCHEVLSRSQLNTLTKLREAGIINSNLVTLPNTSNVSLANNGTHISIGSLKLGQGMADPHSGFTERDEKYIGDLAIKIFEHFLPLFVETYTAAPYRMDFSDFHPEKALGFLPHELHYTHLRMIWRRWRKKAKLKILNKPVTPFGPLWIDNTIKAIFGLKGDFIPDFRLVDYMVCLLSTDDCPALDGSVGNLKKLAKDLQHLGVFHEQMPIYSFYRLRHFEVMGYSGFEGRYYSLFENLQDDMAQATNLQVLVTLFAYKLIATGKATHRSVPDNPFCESERRQIVFNVALNLPTFFVKQESGNVFLKKILKSTGRIRSSARYKGYVRVRTAEYKKALLTYLRKEAAGLIESLGLENMMNDLDRRIDDPIENSAGGKLTRSILDKVNARNPFQLPPEEFNAAAERYFRKDLRERHIQEAVEVLAARFFRDKEFVRFAQNQEPQFLDHLFSRRKAPGFWAKVAGRLAAGVLPRQDLEILIGALLLNIHYDTQQSERIKDAKTSNQVASAPIY